MLSFYYPFLRARNYSILVASIQRWPLPQLMNVLLTGALTTMQIILQCKFFPFFRCSLRFMTGFHLHQDLSFNGYGIHQQKTQNLSMFWNGDTIVADIFQSGFILVDLDILALKYWLLSSNIVCHLGRSCIFSYFHHHFVSC